jgi:hypothetical protein
MAAWRSPKPFVGVRVPPGTPINGSVSEWVKVPHLKCGVSKGTVGSNPTTSAKLFNLILLMFMQYLW